MFFSLLRPGMLASVLASVLALALGCLLVLPPVAMALTPNVVVIDNLPAQGAKQGVQARIVLERSPAQVFALLRQTEKLLKQDPSFVGVKVVERPSANQEKVRYKLKLSPFWPALNYVGQVDFLPNHGGTRFKRLSGDLKAMEGGCALSPVAGNPNRTLVVYTLRVELGLPMPQGVVDHFLRHDLPRSLGILKRAVYKEYP